MKKKELYERFNRLMAKKCLDILTSQEEEELKDMLHRLPELEAIHNRMMTKNDWQQTYELHRKLRRTSPFSRSLKKKGQSRISLRTIFIRYAAAILLPAAALLTYYLINDSPQPTETEKDLSPKPFVATIYSSEGHRKQQTLTISALSSYSVKELGAEQISEEESKHLYTLSTTAQNEFRVTLEDGTTIHLNHNSQLFFPQHFGSMQRRVFLRGEAHVKVSKDSRPFIIATDAGIVKQYGTNFNVKAYDKTQTEVVLIEGSIGIGHNGVDEEHFVRLKPGQMGRIRTNADIQVEEVDTIPYIAWETGRFNFEDYPLENIMEVLERWYDIEVEFKNPRLKTLRFNGDIDRYGSIAPILKAIAHITGVNVSLHGKRVTVGN